MYLENVLLHPQLGNGWTRTFWQKLVFEEEMFVKTMVEEQAAHPRKVARARQNVDIGAHPEACSTVQRLRQDYSLQRDHRQFGIRQHPQHASQLAAQVLVAQRIGLERRGMTCPLRARHSVEIQSAQVAIHQRQNLVLARPLEKEIPAQRSPEQRERTPANMRRHFSACEAKAEFVFRR